MSLAAKKKEVRKIRAWNSYEKLKEELMSIWLVMMKGKLALKKVRKWERLMMEMWDAVIMMLGV